LRETLREKSGVLMARIAYSPGTVAGTTDTAAILDRAIADWSGRERLGIEKLTLDRKDPKERILISFLGIPEEGPDWVGVVFGRGKVIPPLEGAEINAFGLNERLAGLATECTCLMTAAGLGVDIPMKWSGADDATFQPLRDPTVATPEEATAASVNWSPLKSTGIVLGGLAALVVLGGVVLVFGRLGGEGRSWAPTARD
jgi:hypothetical protein